MRGKKIIMMIVCPVIGQAAFLQDKKTRLFQVMKAYHDYNMFDGAVLVAENGNIIYKEAFGLANRENNVNESPNKDLILVTMGNIYLALNKKEEAIRFYKKALQISPWYEEARNRLKELGQ